MDDNDEEGDYNGDFYAKLPEGAEEPRLPIFQNFSFQAGSAVGDGSSTGQQQTQADGAQQNHQPERDDANNGILPELGGDEELSEEEEEGEEGEEEVASEAEDQAAGMTLQQVMDNIDYQLHCLEEEHQMTPAQIQQLAARAQELAPTLPPGDQRHLAERIQGLVGDEQQRVNYWLGRDSNYLLGNPPPEAAREAMSEAALKQRYRGMTAAQRLAHDIPVPHGRPPVAERTLQRYWRRPEGIKEPSNRRKPRRNTKPKGKKGKARAESSDDDDDANYEDSDYENVDENDDEYMDYIPEQAYLAERNLPFLMGVREFDYVKHPTSDPTGDDIEKLVDENGQPVLGPNGNPLRDLPILPRRIPSSIKGWRLAVWMRAE
ncbi:hypothetical protein DBV05_g11559 [Lasiodiplodia theobromae]|uniref:Uncharacterized protein n=1 Tax=Lasiodiplodia theobromae TaxID=45133 RepID=A0A5N5CWN4_9PEZI|nr:hypothetical protein DBV05_g11559 [Lasiodiplodia theobromae]